MSQPSGDFVLIIGAGPAGLMAADVISATGISVIIADAMPSPARKFLMAGKSGLNLTKSEPFCDFVENFGPSKVRLLPMLEKFGPKEVLKWVNDLGQETFVGTTGRVFPKMMKASPLLRALLSRLEDQGVILKRRWRWVGWDDEVLNFETPDGPQSLHPIATVFALGGASWSRLGSDGTWSETLQREGVSIAPFGPSNCGLKVDWTKFMHPYFGSPIKNIELSAGNRTGRGEITISERGLEGGGLYPFSPEFRQGECLTLDLKPDVSLSDLCARVSKARTGQTAKETLRKVVGLSAAQIALLNEFCRPLPRGVELANLVKSFVLPNLPFRPIDEAISTVGGVRFEAYDSGLMLNNKPGVFVAGEMLDWDAPTGGYLLTGCFATGNWAGQSVLRYLAKN